MKLPLDTRVALWCLDDFHKIESTCLKMLKDPDNELFLSVASLWEMAIKIKKLKPGLPENLLHHMCREFQTLNINKDHCMKTMDLPLIHKDPFDRMIIAQAIVGNMPVVTRDGFFSKYSIHVINA